jgi:tetratricopeptide (TPR) repeat protein
MTDIFLTNFAQDRSRMSETDAWLAQALAHFHAGRLDPADSLCRRIIAAAPRHAEAYNLWAAVALQRDEPTLAAERWRSAIAIDAGVREYHHNLGDVLKGLGQLDDAIASFRTALRLAPDSLDTLFVLALCLAERGRNEEAAPLFKTLVAAVPDVAEAYHRLGILHLIARDNARAIADIRRALAIQPDFIDAHTNLAVLLRQEEMTLDAVREFRHALLLRPDDAYLHCNLGTVLRELGSNDDATRLIEHAVALQPDEAEFHYSLAMGRSFKPGDGRLAAMERLAAKLPALDRDAQVNLHFALAKAYEDLGDNDRSFQHQMRGNALKREALAYNEPAVLAGFERIRKVFADLAPAHAEAGDPSDLPIFVLGMPRSGSSLIEQILASHRSVFGAGELPDFSLLARKLGPEAGPGFPEIVPRLQPEEFRQLGGDYVAALRARAPQAARIVDKLPENFRLIGLIHRALPRAKIIHTRRDPIDTCLSIYSKLFTAETPFFYDLAEIGRYWRAYDDLMAFWRQTLPAGSILDVDYEELVRDQERETRRMLEFCGLDWDEACLQFHRTDRQVRTASALQVRKPLYDSSVGRWQPAPDLIAPLLSGLAGS